MERHGNARPTPRGRLLICERVRLENEINMTMPSFGASAENVCQTKRRTARSKER
jgi:hypothetical protein